MSPSRVGGTLNIESASGITMERKDYNIRRAAVRSTINGLAFLTNTAARRWKHDKNMSIFLLTDCRFCFMTAVRKVALWWTGLSCGVGGFSESYFAWLFWFFYVTWQARSGRLQWTALVNFSCTHNKFPMSPSLLDMLCCIRNIGRFPDMLWFIQL